MAVNARIMRLSFFIVLSCLLAVTADTHTKDEKERVLRRNGILKMEISAESRAEFKTYMTNYCITHMSPMEFLSNYIRWENVEFLDSVKALLDPTPTSAKDADSYFHHLGHDFSSNCSVKNDTLIRETHSQINYDTLFDNFMYDQMTRSSWVPLNL